MAILSDINSAVSRMNAASFQQFGDELLCKIYHPMNIESRGSMQGQAKTIKGSPDTVLVLPRGKVLVEYTTQCSCSKTSFLNKLQNDVRSCLDEGKTRIAVSEVSEIVIFANQRIAADMQDDIRKMNELAGTGIKLSFFAIDDISTMVKNYPMFMRDYLGISDYPGLIDIESFVRKSSNSKLSMPIPLNNDYFELKDLSIEQGCSLLEDKDILVISGDAGMGKTRYALEIARRFELDRHSAAYVMEGNEKNVIDMLSDIDMSTSYLFIIDDANRSSVWDEVIRFYSETRHKNIKIIATVRTYAVDSVIEKCGRLKTSAQVRIPGSTEEQISKILVSFGIKNGEWHKRINSITGKNIRLSVMCAQMALAGRKYQELINVEAVYDAYYERVFREVSDYEGNMLLVRVLAVLSFYKIVDLPDTSVLREIEELFNIPAEDFEGTCKKLERLECVDITDDNIVRIPDQNFGNYIFYQCFFVLKKLSLTDLIRNFINNRYRLYDSIFSVWNCFHKDSVREMIRKSVYDAWQSMSRIDGSEEIKNDLLETFGTLIPIETFAYVVKSMRNADENYHYNEFSCDSILSILLNFSHSEENEIKQALMLMVRYLELHPLEFKKTVEEIYEKWVYDDSDILTMYKRQKMIIDALIELSGTDGKGFELAEKILPDFLKIVYHTTRVVHGHDYQLARYGVCLTDELKANREKVWKWIAVNIRKINQTDFIAGLYNEYSEVPDVSREIVMHEKVFLNEVLAHADMENNYKLCCEIESLTDRIRRIAGSGVVEADWNRACASYLLECKINYGCGSDKIKENVGKIVISGTLGDNKILVDDMLKLQELKGYHDSMMLSYVIESALLHNPDEAFELWQYVLDKDEEFNSIRLLNLYVAQGADIDRLMIFIKKQKPQVVYDCLIMLAVTIENPSSHISRGELFHSIIGCATISVKLNSLIKKYFAPKDTLKGSRMVMAALLYRMRNEMETDYTEEFLLYFRVLCPQKLNLVKTIYLYGCGQNENYDYDKKLLKEILKCDSCFWVKCCVEIKRFVKRCHAEPYEFIWKLSNYNDIIEHTLLYYAGKEWIGYDEEDNIYAFFYNLSDSTAADFIDEMILKYCKDRRVASLIFKIVVHCMGEYRVRHFLTFVSHNDSIEDFKRLDLTSGIMYGSYSFVSAVSAKQNFINSMISNIMSLHKIEYMDHLSYLESIKNSYDREYEEEQKRDHINRLYDM